MRPFKNNPPDGAVGIVIPFRDGLPYLMTCLHTLMYFTDRPYMVTLVDNQSGLQTREALKNFARRHKVMLLRYDEEFNFAAEVNMGLRYPFLFPSVRFGLIMNADTIVGPRWLSTLMSVFDGHFGGKVDHARAGIVGPVSNCGGSFQTRLASPHIFKSPAVSGFCMAFRRETYEEVGGFDEQFKGGCWEDADFCVRARAKGWGVYVDGRVFVTHFGQVFRAGQAHRVNALENRARFFSKHPGLADFANGEKHAGNA